MINANVSAILTILLAACSSDKESTKPPDTEGEPQWPENCHDVEPTAPATESADNAISCIEGYDIPRLVESLSLPSKYELEIGKVSNRKECPDDMMKIRSLRDTSSVASQSVPLVIDCANSPILSETPEGTIHCVKLDVMSAFFQNPVVNDLGEFLLDEAQTGCDGEPGILVVTKGPLKETLP
jgi:hypothetical protein